MNQNDFKEFSRLETLLNEKVISPIDFWQRIRELKSMSTGALNKIQQKLFTLEAKPYTGNFDPLAIQKYNFLEEIVRMKPIPIPPVPLVHTTYNPAGHSHYIEARTSGEIMLHKLGYAESMSEHDLMITGNYPNNKRTFERVRTQTVDYIEFSKIYNEIHFISFLTRKTHAPYGNPKEPKQVTRKELDAIIQIITEWMD